MTPAARKETILAAIVESFIQSGEPVGSKALLGGTPWATATTSTT